MNDSFLITVYILSIIIHIIAFIVHSTWVVPLQIKEAQVKNGLRELRILMLISGISMMLIGFVSILVLSARFYIQTGTIAQIYYIGLILLHSFGFLAFAFITRRMYRQQYSEEQKELHSRIDTMEKEDKKIGK